VLDDVNVSTNLYLAVWSQIEKFSPGHRDVAARADALTTRLCETLSPLLRSKSRDAKDSLSWAVLIENASLQAKESMRSIVNELKQCITGCLLVKVKDLLPLHGYFELYAPSKGASFDDNVIDRATFK
jgi:hypothetical protein